MALEMLLVTHDGKFHLDEVLATAVLLKIYPDAEIVRTRNVDAIQMGDIIYDVGRICDPSNNRFDHHHASFDETFNPKYRIKLSSSGLIYKYYGGRFLHTYGINEADIHFQRTFEEVYERYFLAADAIDNGYEIFGEIVPRSLSHIVTSFNLYDFSSCSVDTQNRRFLDAVRFVMTDLDNFMNTIVSEWMPSYKLLENMIKDLEGDILCVDRHCFVDSIPELEGKYKKNIKFVLNKSGNSVNILAVPKKKNHFESKVPLKKEWRGLVGKNLENVSNIKGCNFVHASGFVGSNKTLEGAFEMCRASIDCTPEETNNKFM